MTTFRLLLCKLYDVTDADLDTFLRGVYHENLRDTRMESICARGSLITLITHCARNQDGDMFLGLRLDVERRTVRFAQSHNPMPPEGFYIASRSPIPALYSAVSARVLT